MLTNITFREIHVVWCALSDLLLSSVTRLLKSVECECLATGIDSYGEGCCERWYYSLSDSPPPPPPQTPVVSGLTSSGLNLAFLHNIFLRLLLLLLLPFLSFSYFCFDANGLSARRDSFCQRVSVRSVWRVMRSQRQGNHPAVHTSMLFPDEQFLGAQKVCTIQFGSALLKKYSVFILFEKSHHYHALYSHRTYHDALDLYYHGIRVQYVLNS